MELLKKFEQQIFAHIINLQRVRFQSSVVFIFASILRFICKDAFLVILFLLKIDLINSINNSLTHSIQNNSTIVALSMLVFVLLVYLLYVPGNFWGENVVQLTRILLPFIDICTFPIVTLSIAVTCTSGSAGVQAAGIVSAMGMSFIGLAYNFLNCSKFPKTANLFQFKQSKNVMLSYIIELAICYYLAIPWIKSSNFSYFQLLAFCTIKLFLTAIKLQHKIIYQFYIHPLSQKISSFFFLMEINLSVIAVAMAILQIDLIASNIVEVLAIMNVLAYFSLSIYIEKRDSQFFLSSAKEIRGEQQAFLYIDCLRQLVRKIQNEQEDIILISLKTKHEINCVNLDCFCRRDVKSLKKFIQNYVKAQLEVIAETFHNSVSVLLSILYFKMVLFKFYPQILSKLQEAETKFNFSVFQRFYKYSLSKYVQDFIYHKNFEIEAVQSQQMLRLQQLVIQLQRLIKNQIELRQKKWRYLVRGLCQVSDLKSICQNQLNSIKRIMQIYEQKKVRFKKSKQFNLLMLFYFTKVSFLSNGKDIKTNIKEIHYGYRVDDLLSIKQFQKFIYHKRSCAIQTHIDTKVMGIITAASHNVEEMFGFAYEKIIGKSINNLMPDIMQTQHDTIMMDWAKSGTWRTIGKLKEIYCIHKQQYCFSALLYLKIYVKETGLHFITNIFKLNESDYLVLNDQGCIEGIGRKFLKILGESAKRMPLRLLTDSKNQEIQKITFEQQKTYRRVFMGLKNSQKQVQNYFQQTNNRFSDKSKTQINESFYKWLVSNSVEKHFVEFKPHSYRMGRLQFWVLQMIDSRVIDRKNTNYYLEHTSNYISSLKENDDFDFEVEERRSSQSLDDEENQKNLFDANGTSSMTSISQKQNYPLSKLFQDFLQLLQKPLKIKDTRIVHMTWCFSIIVVLLILVNFISSWVYKVGMSEIQDIYTADGTVSDIMQTTQIAYDHVLNLKAQLVASNYADFDSQIKSAQYVQNYVYTLKEYTFSRYLSDRTALRNQKYYSYIQSPTQWHKNLQGNNTIAIQTYQFLECMYYLTGHLINQLKTMRASNNTNFNTTNKNVFNTDYLQMLMQNFLELQKINEVELILYQQRSDSSHTMLDYLSTFFLVIYLVITLIGAAIVDSYYRFRYNQVQDSFKFFGLVPYVFFQRLKQYYNQMIKTVSHNNSLSEIDKNEEKLFSIETQQLFLRPQEGKHSFNSKLRLVNYNNYYTWIIILIVLLAFNGLNFLSVLNLKTFFEPSRKAMGSINDLMRSENRLLQSYFEMKAAYYNDSMNGFTEANLNQWQKHLNVTILSWNVVATNLSKVLSNYDVDFQKNFITILIQDVCTLTSSLLPSTQVTKCTAQMTYKIMQGGMMMSMNFFQVTIEGLLEQMRAQYVYKQKAIQVGNYLRRPDFVQLDRMQIYMFKIYQLTQSIYYDSYKRILESISKNFITYSIIFTFLYLLLLATWIYRMEIQKIKLSTLYGQLLLIPFHILKSNSRIVSTFKDAIQYEQ